MVYRVRKQKYNAKKTVGVDAEGNRTWFPSKLEAGVAAELYVLFKAKEILYFDCQYKVEMPVYTSTGEVAYTINHKVDFRQHNLDGTFTLIEAKGFSTSDWRFRKNLLTEVWLLDHLDYDYEVRKSFRK